MLTLIELSNCPPMFQCCGNVDDDPEADQSEADPQGPPARSGRRLLTASGEFAQEPTKTGHDESESHQRQACPDPGQQRAFGGKAHPWVR